MATKWLSPAQTAKQLNVSESTVWRLLRREALPSVKVGGRRRVPAAAIGRVAKPARRWLAVGEIPGLTLEDPMFRLAGHFRSNGEGPGSSDKHAYLGVKR